ncbi:alpha/beta hydrolase family protein [Hirsutella rhossiliensis]|uniref:Alpha/beta hydrolase family domain-containing protein n=1 Tax=Hirsutella rhossiliensis TaxID=111463 RepID=A0A9P8MWZ2_9HYPO|nr:alpha/beta hydrolase family domain-containing protein [Hirsutella rhossiliensis]KAH0962760.1 alpha/beta hydrolase family domain-containing protein [Hirsutella rhossiliensis]
MATDKPVVLIIGGGWQSPASYDKLAKALEAASYEVHCPRHPSLNQARPPTDGLASDSRHMRAYAKKLVDSGRRVVALMHSYGGQVGSNSLHGLGLDSRSKRGLPGGVSDLVYLCAFALPEGGSVAGKIKEMGDEAFMPFLLNFDQDMTLFFHGPPGSASADQRGFEADINATMVRWNGECLYNAITHCAWREMPVTYIYTPYDSVMSLTYQTSMVALLEEQGRKVQTYKLATGHFAHLTAADAIVDVINKVVRGIPTVVHGTEQ